jgi:exocyst complex component 2
MPLSADQERRLLNHYKLTTLYPDTWPHQDDDNASDSSSDDDDSPGIRAANGAGGPVRKISKNNSKYSSINRHASIRSSSSLTPNSIVQADEPDPLGMAPSVAAELRRRGVPVEEDLKLRNKFMLSSTTFSPQLFLSQVHQDASTEDLLRGLEYLGRSIESKSASLKVLVESHFEKFVKAKSVIDNVYSEMRMQGVADADSTPSATPALGTTAGRRPHSRHTSRSQNTHFRNTSGPFSPSLGTPGSHSARAATGAKKNALTKESEYGVLGIKQPLTDVAIKAEEVWGPALGGREKEETLRSILGSLDANGDVFRLGATIAEAIRKNDYDAVVDCSKKANRCAEQARQVADMASRTGVGIGDQDAQQILIMAKAYHDVSSQLEVFKKDLWRRLKSSHGRNKAEMVGTGAEEADKEEHVQLIAVLLQLGVDENPIWEWLNSKCLYLKDKIARAFERSRIEIEIQRRRLAAVADRIDGKTAAAYLRSAGWQRPHQRHRQPRRPLLLGEGPHQPPRPPQRPNRHPRRDPRLLGYDAILHRQPRAKVLPERRFRGRKHSYRTPRARTRRRAESASGCARARHIVAGECASVFRGCAGRGSE